MAQTSPIEPLILPKNKSKRFKSKEPIAAVDLISASGVAPVT